MPTTRELNRRMKAILAQRRPTTHRPGPSGRHRQADPWNRLLMWTCVGSEAVIGAVMVLTVGWWAVFLTLLALAVGLIAVSVDS